MVHEEIKLEIKTILIVIHVFHIWILGLQLQQNNIKNMLCINKEIVLRLHVKIFRKILS